MSDLINEDLRANIKQVRLKTSNTNRLLSSKQISTRACSLDQYKQAQRIGLYSSINGEIDLSSMFLSACAEGKLCFFPVLNDNLTLSFLPATPSTPFKKNRYGIPEPDVSRESAIAGDQLDIIMIPLVAFDVWCNRIGMGAGYYDRTLENNINSLLIGVGYQFQRVDFIDTQPWDIPLDAIITQKAIYWRRVRRRQSS